MTTATTTARAAFEQRSANTEAQRHDQRSCRQRITEQHARRQGRQHGIIEVNAGDAAQARLRQHLCHKIGIAFETGIGTRAGNVAGKIAR
jgi:hypothetical protein